MSMYDEMKNLFEFANSKYLIEQKELIQSGVSERTLCGQLMLYLNKNSIDFTAKEEGILIIQLIKNI